MVLDVVVHETGLVTQWASGDCVGDTVTITEPKGSFTLPADALWVYLVGDLTALPAMARIVETLGPDVPVKVWAEVAEQVPGYFGEDFVNRGDLSWIPHQAEHGSGLATWVESLPWPEEPGYFWMAGESAQMRAIRKHLMRELKLPPTAYDVMGYWRGVAKRQPRSVDPGRSEEHTSELQSLMRISYAVFCLKK